MLDRSTNILVKIALGAVLVTVGSACASSSKDNDDYLLKPAKADSKSGTKNYTGNDLQQSIRFTTISKNIRFDYASAELNSDTRKSLDTLAAEINSSLGSFDKIRVAGFTDASGDDVRNVRLSQQRAENVRRYLISKGVPADKLESVGMGPIQNPVSGTKMKAAADRRVDFEIVR